MHPLRSTLLGVLIAIVMAVAAQSQSLPLGLEAQLQALLHEKASRSLVERKIASRLLHAERQRRGLSIAQGLPTLRTGVELAPDGRVAIEVRTESTDEVVSAILELGGSIEFASGTLGSVTARLPLTALRELAALDAVRSIRSVARIHPRMLSTSEGDTAHGADLARTAFGVDGSGVLIGVISDGVDALSALQNTGDLPAGVFVLPGQAGFGSEGTAMLEIIHDLAPGADLMFATGAFGSAAFATNILAMQAAGASIIVDDLFAYDQSVFQDDIVASTIDTVAQAGVLYFSSAGNAGNLASGSAGVWEGDWASSGELRNGQEVHDFGGGVTANAITLTSPLIGYSLHWSDPNGASLNDYDLVLVDSGGALVAASTDVQDGNDDPFEMIAGGLGDTGGSLMIVRSPLASDRHLHLNANRGRLEIGTEGQIGGHTAARGAFSIAAADVGGGAPFDGSETVKPYSSDGPRRVFFEADGSEITPGNLLATGGRSARNRTSPQRIASAPTHPPTCRSAEPLQRLPMPQRSPLYCSSEMAT